MLERVQITDFAVARSVLIEPGPGLNVFTGETGAGKSLVVDALSFLFGGRRGREVIATGAERATVTATLRFGEQTRTVERTIANSGRASARIDGEPASVDQLRALADGLIDIHGQSEQLAILRPSVQLSVLDTFAALGPTREAIGQLVRALRDVRREIRTLASDARERERLVDQLRFETEEIAAAALQEGEDEALRVEQARLGGARRLIEDASRALEALNGAAWGEAVAAVREVGTRDPSAAGMAALGETIEATVSDLARELRRYREAIEEDPERLAVTQERLDRIARLCRKYGESLSDVLAYGEASTERLARLTSAEFSHEALEARQATLLAELAAAASDLSRQRRARAGDLVRAIAAELEHLGMGAAALSVGFACEDDADGPPASLPDYEIVLTSSPLAGEGEAHPRAFNETGIDRVEFLASFNEGESPRPLSAVASGGETSRFLLALTTVLGNASEARLEVLDEVDEGVGG
ncbi:MAG: AAA family ATPase, partial [Tepidiformaceae bacterium]